MSGTVAGFWWLVACGLALSGQSLTISQAVEGALGELQDDIKMHNRKERNRFKRP